VPAAAVRRRTHQRAEIGAGRQQLQGWIRILAILYLAVIAGSLQGDAAISCSFSAVGHQIASLRSQ
jgi:hypothetical protein